MNTYFVKLNLICLLFIQEGSCKILWMERLLYSELLHFEEQCVYELINRWKLYLRLPWRKH